MPDTPKALRNSASTVRLSESPRRSRSWSSACANSWGTLRIVIVFIAAPVVTAFRCSLCSHGSVCNPKARVDRAWTQQMGQGWWIHDLTDWPQANMAFSLCSHSSSSTTSKRTTLPRMAGTKSAQSVFLACCEQMSNTERL